jgi:phospholipid methyltransferase
LISLEIVATFALSYGVFIGLNIALGSRAALVLPWTVRLAGILAIAGGAGVAIDTLRFRPPVQMLLSTALTLRKFFSRRHRDSSAPREEPFIVLGPYRYVRNPLYLSVLLIVFGFAVLDSSTSLAIWGVVLIGWYALILIPFEEKELRALFGREYESYRRQVPMLLPRRLGFGRPGNLRN